MAKFGEYVIWQTDGNDIFGLQNNTLYSLSENIKPYLTELFRNNTEIPQAVAFQNYYMLCLKHKAVIMNLRAKNEAAWFTWEFPEDCNICGAFPYNGKPLLLCTDADKSICYIAELTGDKDTVLTYERGEIIANRSDIKSEIETKKYEPSRLGSAVKLTKIYLNLEASGDTAIKVITDDETYLYSLTETDTCKKSPKIVRLITNLKCSGKIALALSSRKPFKLGKAEIYYTETGN